MTARIKGWLLAALLFIGALLVAWLRGRRSGSQSVRAEQAGDAMAQAEEAHQSVREAQDEVNRMPSGGAHSRLRDKWMRK